MIEQVPKRNRILRIIILSYLLLSAAEVFKLVSSMRIIPIYSDSEEEERTNYYESDQDRRRMQHVKDRINRGAQQSMAQIPKSPDGHLVTELPLWSEVEGTLMKQWAGHLPASEVDDKYLFYWLFAPDLSLAADQQEKDIPLLIWLNGGPGCSSMTGLFLENGPFMFNLNNATNQYELKRNPYSWHTIPAYTLYIDQPVGTGLSFTRKYDYASNDKEVNTDFYYFLQAFLKLHSDKFVDKGSNTLNRKLYFSGESHAGHYIPSMMNYILNANTNMGRGMINIPLSGAAIGNGWIEPYYQYAAADAAYSHGLVGRGQVYDLNTKEVQCQNLLKGGQYYSKLCLDLLDDIIAQAWGSDGNFEVNKYDVRLKQPKHVPRDYPPGKNVMECYLGGQKLTSEKGKLSHELYTQVLKAIHATAATDAGLAFKECANPPSSALIHQDGLGVSQDVVDVLNDDNKIRLLFFNGMEDLVCHHDGSEKLLENLEWSGQEEWITARRSAWVSSLEKEAGKVNGYAKEYKNLMFLKLKDAGHMVPVDIPHVAFDMMQTFINAGSFSNRIQNLPASLPQKSACLACPDCDVCEICTAYLEAPAASKSGLLMWVFVSSVLIACISGMILIRQCWKYSQVTTSPVELVLELRQEQ